MALIRWAVLAVCAAVLVRLWASHTGEKPDIQVITESKIIEEHLRPHQKVLGDEYDAYRGHVYRVFSYTLHFLGSERLRSVIETALVYHDIGLWTDSQLSYLKPSVQRALEKVDGKYSSEEKQLVEDIIMNHHMATAFHGPNEDIVNAVRMADWIDFSMGVVTHGMSWANIAKVNGALPEAGFHMILASMIPRIRHYNFLLGLWEYDIFRWH